MAKIDIQAFKRQAYLGVQAGLSALVILQGHQVLFALLPLEALGLQGMNHLFFLVHQGHLECVIGKYIRQKIG